MAKMVERVTRAAYEWYLEGLIGCCEPTWDMLPQSHRDNLMGAQRAAITAMREPTLDMRHAGQIYFVNRLIKRFPKTGGWDVKSGGYAMRNAWQAMIDAALQEGKP